MYYRLLGPLEVGRDADPVPIGGPQQRELLALLLLDANQVVPADRLVDQLWPARPPGTARGLLNGCVSDLRRALRSAGPAQPLQTRSPGYLLRVGPGERDVDRVAELEAAAARAAAAGTRTALERSAALLAEAAALWRGPVLAGLDRAAGTAEAARLAERGLALQDRRADLDLRLGRFAELVGELRARLRQDPLRETVWSRLMLALYGAGRPADALAAYQEARRVLAEQLGIGPGAGLRQLERAMLARADVADLVRGQVGELPAADGATATARPAQLPVAVRAFAGREGELAELDAVLVPGPAGTAAAAISAVSGSAGVGKTALAVHWAHRAARHFPDGQLYVDLRGFDPAGRPVEPATALRGFLHALGVPAARFPADLDALAARYRSVLSGRRVLVVLDNARDADQVRPLLPGTGTAAAVVTSRNRLPGLVAVEGARPLALGVLAAPAARDLLAGRLGADRLAAEPAAVDRIVARCAGLPLALAIVAARAATRPATLGALAAELAGARDQLDALDAGDASSRLRAVFSWSYAALTPPAAALFRLAGVHPGPDLSAAAAAALAGRPARETGRLLAELTRENLLAEHRPGRYALHDLLRAYAADAAREHDPEPARHAAVARVLDHCVPTAVAAARLLRPERDPPSVPLPPAGAGHPGDGHLGDGHLGDEHLGDGHLGDEHLGDGHPGDERLGDQRAAVEWLAAEHPVLVGLQPLAARLGHDAHAWTLAWSLDPFLRRRADWSGCAAAWQVAESAAERLGDRSGQAYANTMLAVTGKRRGRYAEARAALDRARAMYEEAGDLGGAAGTWLALADHTHREPGGDAGAALAQARRALDLYRAGRHQRGEASALNTIGWYLIQGGRPLDALASCTQALDLQQRLGLRDGEALTWDSLGFAHHRLGRPAAAAECYRRALVLFRAGQDRYNEADTLLRLGDALHDGGGPAARDCWEQGLAILQDLDPDLPEIGDARARLATGPGG